MKVRFFMMRSKGNTTTGTKPIYAKITHANRSTYIAAEVYVKPEHWSQSAQMVTGGETKENDNIKLNLLKTEIDTNHLLLKAKRKSVSAHILKQQTKLSGHIKTFLEVMEEYNTEIIQNKPDTPANEIKSKDTLKTYRYRFDNFRQFLLHEKKTGLAIDELNHTLLNKLKSWLGSKKKSESIAYHAKHIYLIQAIERYAHDQHYIDRLNLSNYTAYPGCEEDYDNVPHIDESELPGLLNFAPANPQLEKVKDLIIFQCFTGMAYADLMKFEKSMIVKDRGVMFIKYKRTKTKVPATPILLPESKAIIDKYNGVLPKISNKEYNLYLKVVAAFSGITVELSSHVGRKTFGMRMLNEYCFKIEEVSRMLGHATVSTTQKYYARVNSNRIINAVSKPKFDIVSIVQELAEAA